MAYRNRKAYSKTARRGIPRAQDNIPSRWDRFKNWAGDKYQDFQDSTINMSNIVGDGKGSERYANRVYDTRSQYHNVKRALGDGAPGSKVDQGVVDYVASNPDSPYYAMLEKGISEQNPGIEDTFAGPLAPGQTGFDALGNEEGNIDMDMSQSDRLLAQQANTKQPPFIKRGGILKRGGATRASNVMGKGGTPKARRGGSVGRNGIL